MDLTAMLPLFARKAPPTAYINGTAVIVGPKETLLHAALRAGIDFPHSCRVGSCTTCKCKLLQGKVRELTRTSYVLTAEELAQGYILACQSVPQTDVHVEAKLGGGTLAAGGPEAPFENSGAEANITSPRSLAHQTRGGRGCEVGRRR